MTLNYQMTLACNGVNLKQCCCLRLPEGGCHHFYKKIPKKIKIVDKKHIVHSPGRLEPGVEGKIPAEATDASFKRRMGSRNFNPSVTVFKNVKKFDKILF